MIDVKVKICGITNLEDALAAVQMGADILGFNFYSRSPRYIEPQKARQIIAKLPSFVDTAGVFVNVPMRDIHLLTSSGLINWVQLHGDESPQACAEFDTWNIKTIKAIRVRSAQDIQKAQEYRTYAVLFDAFDRTLYGGTGKMFDWQLVKNCTQRVFIAGGVTPENVDKALALGVFGIDVCSGIESRPGIKDHEKMRALFEAVYRFTGQKVRHAI